MTKIKNIGLVGISGLALSLILLFIVNFKRTDLLVSFGSKVFKLFNILAIVILVFSLLTIIASVVMFIMNKQKESTLREIETEQAKDPLYEEASVVSKLSTLQERYSLQTSPESKPYKQAINEILHQLEEAKTLYRNYYAEHPFTHISDVPVDVKQVVNTNKCLISLEVQEGNLLITSVIDNLTKGASGQAVQNMNLMFGLDEKTGLGLKSVGM
jgi:hypothetical protein